MSAKMKVWECRIGEVEDGTLPAGSDYPMRSAVIEAYVELTGRNPVACFSGWGNEFTEIERAVIENREPNPDLPSERDLLEEAWGVIANASGGDWARASPEWRDAAARWRDRYHATLVPCHREGDVEPT